MLTVSFVGAWVIPYFLGLRGQFLPYLIFAWIPCFVVLMTGFGMVLNGRVEPRLKPFRPNQKSIVQSVITFFAFWFACWFIGVFYSLGFWGSMMVALGGTHREISEQLDFLSIPLGWASSTFVIRPHMNFFEVCGIIGFNTFFQAAILFFVFSAVHSFLKRAKPIQLGLGSTSARDDHSNE